MSVEWLSEQEQQAWLGLAAVVELLPARLDAQLRRDFNLTHFEYMVLAMLSESPDRTLRMTELASQTNATLPRLSHVARRLQERGLVARASSPEDARATQVTLTEEGMSLLRVAAPDHVATVRSYVFDALSPGQVAELSAITGAMLDTLDPGSVMAASLRHRKGAGAS